MRSTCLSLLSMLPVVVAAAPSSQAPTTATHGAQDDDALWSRVSELGTESALRYYLTQNPEGSHVSEARDLLGEESAAAYDESVADKVVLIGRSKDNRVEGIHLMFVRFTTLLDGRMVTVSLVLGSKLDEDGNVTGNVNTDPFADVAYTTPPGPPEGPFSIVDGSGTRIALTGDGVTTFLKTVSAVRIRPAAPDAASPPPVHIRGDLAYDSIEGDTTTAKLLGHLDGRDENALSCLLSSTSAAFGTTGAALKERLPHAEASPEGAEVGPIVLFEYDGIARTLTLVR